MLIQIISVNHKLPEWADLAAQDYLKRFGKEINIKLEEISPKPRTKNNSNPSDIIKLIHEEGLSIKNKIPKDSYIIALDVLGKAFSTEDLSKYLNQWMHGGRNICMIIGGADGLSPEILNQADLKLSLSQLTFPHPLAKIILIEQLYRAHSILKNHPYHRA